MPDCFNALACVQDRGWLTWVIEWLLWCSANVFCMTPAVIMLIHYLVSLCIFRRGFAECFIVGLGTLVGIAFTFLFTLVLGSFALTQGWH